MPCRLRYSIHLWDLKHPGTWESKGTYVYYTDFIMELAMLFLDLVHHIHMLVRRRGTSVASASCFQLPLFYLYNHVLLSASRSFSVTSGCPWQAWLFSCSCGISSMRSSAVSADTRTTCVSLTTWRPGE